MRFEWIGTILDHTSEHVCYEGQAVSLIFPDVYPSLVHQQFLKICMCVFRILEASDRVNQMGLVKPRSEKQIQGYF